MDNKKSDNKKNDKKGLNLCPQTKKNKLKDMLRTLATESMQLMIKLEIRFPFPFQHQQQPKDLTQYQ